MMDLDSLAQDLWAITAKTLRIHGEISNPIIVFFDTKLKTLQMIEAPERRDLTRLIVKELIAKFNYDVVAMISEAFYRQLPEGMQASEVDVFLNSGGREQIKPLDVAVIRIITITEQRTQVKRVVRDGKGRAKLHDLENPFDGSVFYDANLEGVFDTTKPH
jgi:hypothetical protein